MTSDGVVSLVHPDMFYTGETVMIDHGLGLQTVYTHMSRIDVKSGQRVSRARPSVWWADTGCATGPHPHWGANWLDYRLDPQTLLHLAQP